MKACSDHRSVRFHLSYPKQATVFTWPECACLARSLGYRAESIELCYRQALEVKHQTDGFQLAQLDAFLGSKFFKSGFDFAYNSHSCEWNEQVVRRAFAVLAGRGMTFQQLYTIRIAYGLYESSDLRGLKAKPRTVMRALKACGRAISLGKMAHRVRHMRFHEPGRLQLDEFIDLALWAGPLDREEARSALPNTGSSRDQFASFEDLLTPLDGRIQRRLDAEYRREERQYVREKVRADEPRLGACSVLGFRQARLARGREARAALDPLLSRALSREGSRGSPTTAKLASASDHRWSDWTDDDCDSDEEQEEAELNVRKRRPATARAPALVTASDLARTELLRDALAFQGDALAEFHSRWTAESMQTLRPGFQGRHALRMEVAASKAAAAARAAEEASLRAQAIDARRAKLEFRQMPQRRFEELAARTEPTPLPSHGRVCDAPARAAGGFDHGLRRPATAAPTSVSRRHQQQRQTVGDSVTPTEPTTTSWLEPRLGLSLPLAPATRPTVSRQNFARSCRPRVHPVGATVALDNATESVEVAELIQRTVYGLA